MNIKQVKSLEGESKTKVLGLTVLLLVVFSAGCLAIPKKDGKKFDYGDAPDPRYPSLLMSDGARHADITRAWFGKSVSDELNSSQVNLDPFDDGLNGVLPVSFSVYNKDWEGDLFVNILIDWNQDGDWENATSNGPDPKEWAVQNMLLKIPKDETRAYTTNVSLPKETWMRMTITSVRLNNYIGEGEFKIGETEDHIYELIPPTTSTTTTYTTTTTTTTTTSSTTTSTTQNGPTTTTLGRVITPRCGDGYISSPDKPGGGQEECDLGGGRYAKKDANGNPMTYPDTCEAPLVCVACQCVIPIEIVELDLIGPGGIKIPLDDIDEEIITEGGEVFSCGQNTKEVDETDINRYPPKTFPYACITSDCPEGYVCVESSCTCVKETPTTTTTLPSVSRLDILRGIGPFDLDDVLEDFEEIHDIDDDSNTEAPGALPDNRGDDFILTPAPRQEFDDKWIVTELSNQGDGEFLIDLSDNWAINQFQRTNTRHHGVWRNVDGRTNIDKANDFPVYNDIFIVDRTESSITILPALRVGNLQHLHGNVIELGGQDLLIKEVDTGSIDLLPTVESTLIDASSQDMVDASIPLPGSDARLGLSGLIDNSGGPSGNFAIIENGQITSSDHKDIQLGRGVLGYDEARVDVNDGGWDHEFRLEDSLMEIQRGEARRLGETDSFFVYTNNREIDIVEFDSQLLDSFALN
jgi:hypothetical protein